MEKKEKEKGKEEKGKIIFSKSLFLKISPNNEPHKIPVLSPELPDLAKLPGICSRSQTGDYTIYPPEYYLSSKSNIHFIMSYNPSTAVFCKSAKIIINKPVDLVCGGGMKTFIERIRLSPVPFEVNINLTSQKLPRTIPRKNPTTVVFPEFFKYCKIIQNLVLAAQKSLIYKAFSEFSKNFNFPTIFSVSSKHFRPTKEKENPLFIGVLRLFTTLFHRTHEIKSNNMIWKRYEWQNSVKNIFSYNCLY